MPRRGKKTGVQFDRNFGQLSTKFDFTVYEFARNTKTTNASVIQGAPTARLGKATANAWRTEAKELRGQSVLQQRHLVNECCDDDFEVDEDGTTDAPNGCMQPPSETGKVSNRRRKNMRRPAGGQDSGGVIYPADLWFLIGDYVKPEDMATFALICRGTHVVVHSAKFWFSLYRRYCTTSTNLPISLQPARVEQRVHGLRTRVVRALYIAYAPLSARLTGLNATMSRLDSQYLQCLVGFRCVLAWHERVNKQQWHFFFRFQRGSAKRFCSLSASREHTDELLAPADVMHNANERYVVLVATAPHFIELPYVMGQVLVQASLTGAFHTQCLKLIFCAEYVHANRAKFVGAATTSIDSVASVRILNWWHPGYPHRN